MNESLRARLRAMGVAGERLRAERVRDGTLFDGYNPRMAERQACITAGRSGSAADRAAAADPVTGGRGMRDAGDYGSRQREIRAWAERVGWMAASAGRELRGISDG